MPEEKIRTKEEFTAFLCKYNIPFDSENDSVKFEGISFRFSGYFIVVKSCAVGYLTTHYVNYLTINYTTKGLLHITGLLHLDCEINCFDMEFEKYSRNIP